MDSIFKESMGNVALWIPNKMGEQLNHAIKESMGNFNLWISNKIKEWLDNLHWSLLGKSGVITLGFKELGVLPLEAKKRQGQILTSAKIAIEQVYREQSDLIQKKLIDEQIKNDLVDGGLIGPRIPKGHHHLIAQTATHIEQLLQQMGFAITYGNELASQYANFVSVNIPLTHPAVDTQDTYFCSNQEGPIDVGWKEKKPLVLRTHTSALQNTLIKKYLKEYKETLGQTDDGWKDTLFQSEGFGCKFAVPGRVYRAESIDAKHDTMFRQIEGVVIDTGVSIAHFKHAMLQILSWLFERDVNIRLRPGYFPFVEPGFEIDVQCTPEEPALYQLSKGTGWLEVLGAGMIHPSVLREAGLDPEVYSGFAFGLGLSRLVAIKYNIHDIRLFTNGDLRFASSR